MKNARLILSLGVLLIGCSALVVAAEKRETKEITTTGKETERATAVDFTKALGLTFESLEDLGSKIEQARKSPDPLALVSLANVLAAAETVSDKKASLTSEALIKEATEMVKQRRSSTELKAFALLIKDDSAIKTLNSLAKQAAKHEKAARDAAKAGEKGRGIAGYVTVVNNTAYRIYIWEDSRQLGWVNPFRTYRFPQRIGHGASYNSVLHGRAGGMNWGPERIDYSVGDYTWTLN